MKTRWLWLCLIVPVLLGAGVLAVLVEPTRTVRGVLAGEPFYRERPASYWREVLKACGHNGSIPAATAARFWDVGAAFPVLRQCAHDPDRDVRWPAIALLGKASLRTQQALEVLLEALEDVDPEVRLQAIAGLARWGRMARPAVPALAVRLQDSELQVAFCADLALWQIDPAGAAATCGWRLFTSREFGFSVMMPARPEREDRPFLGGLTLGHSFQCSHRTGVHECPTRYIALVAEYPEAVGRATEEERFQAMRDTVPFFFPRGKVVEEKKVVQGGLRGREFVIEAEALGMLRQRAFWVGRKVYGVSVVYKPEFLNAPAAAYFLDSFHLQGARG